MEPLIPFPVLERRRHNFPCFTKYGRKALTLHRWFKDEPLFTPYVMQVESIPALHERIEVYFVLTSMGNGVDSNTTMWYMYHDVVPMSTKK